MSNNKTNLVGVFEFFSGVELVKVENEADSFGTIIPLNFEAELFLGAINMILIISISEMLS